MMEAAPAAPLEVPEPDLLLEFLIVALDAPAQLGKIDQLFEADIRRERREPVFGRRGFVLGPLDQQPLFCQQFREQIAVGGAHANAREARGQPIGRAFAPADRAPSLLGQAEREFLDRDQIGFVAPSSVVDRLAPPPRPGAGRPHQAVRLNAGHVEQAQRSCSSAICGLVLNPTVAGMWAFLRRTSSSAQSFGRYSRYATGRLAW